MGKKTLERVVKLAKHLSPEDRRQLIQDLVELPDSLIKPVQMPGKKRLSKRLEEGREIRFRGSAKLENGEVVYYLDGREVFRAIFHSDTYAEVFFEKLKSDERYLRISDEARSILRSVVLERVRAKEGAVISEESAKQEAAIGDNLSIRDAATPDAHSEQEVAARERSEEEPIFSEDRWEELEAEALRVLGLRYLNDSIQTATKRISDNLPQAVVMIFQKLVPATFFGSSNALRDTLLVPEQKYSASEIREFIFQEERAVWDRIKILTGSRHGGARRREGFVWTNEKKLAFYKQVEALPVYKGKSVWQVLLDELIEQEFDDETVTWLRTRAVVRDIPKELFDSAIKTWRKYRVDDNWRQMNPRHKPRGLGFYHALHLLGYPDRFAYKTLETYYYEGKNLSDNQL